MSVQRDSRIDSLGNDERSVLILKDILRDFGNDVSSINELLGVVQRRISPPTGGGGIGVSPSPPNFRGQVQLLSIYLEWDEPEPDARMFEIRRTTSDLIWETADFVTRTPSLTVNLAPLTAGSYFFLIKSIDALGNYSIDHAYTSISVIPPGAPFLTAQVIDNNVLLYWNFPTTSHQISYFNIYRDGVFFGLSRNTFAPIFETIAGIYTYTIEAVDIAGNVGPLGSVTTQVNAPPDFELQDRRITNLNGTCVNTVRLPTIPSILACTYTNLSWESHFQSFGFATIQDQINAGYPIYIQPSVLTGSYEEVIDYLTVITNTIVTINYQYVQIVPNVEMVIMLSYSEDNITYTPFVVGNSQFIPSFRYLKMRLEFTGSDDHALAEFSMIQITLDVKREIDSGFVIALATDPNGTHVTFNKPFKDIDSVTCTADSIEPIDVIYDFLDVPNPTGFQVYAMDTTGNRVTYLVSWKARGVV